MTTTTHAHEDWQISKDAAGQPYCTVCGEHPDPVRAALSAYRAAQDEVRRAEHQRQKAAQALYEARRAAGSSGSDDADLLPAEARIAYVEEKTVDNRMINAGAVDWQFGQRIPVSNGFEGGQVIGHAIPSHIDETGAVMATLYIEVDALDLLGSSFSVGIGLDSLEVDLDKGSESAMTIKSGRLRQVVVDGKATPSWPGCVITR